MLAVETAATGATIAGPAPGTAGTFSSNTPTNARSVRLLNQHQAHHRHYVPPAHHHQPARCPLPAARYLPPPIYPARAQAPRQLPSSPTLTHSSSSSSFPPSPPFLLSSRHWQASSLVSCIFPPPLAAASIACYLAQLLTPARPKSLRTGSHPQQLPSVRRSLPRLHTNTHTQITSTASHNGSGHHHRQRRQPLCQRQDSALRCSQPAPQPAPRARPLPRQDPMLRLRPPAPSCPGHA